MLKEHRAYTNLPENSVKPKDVTAFVATWTTELKLCFLADPTYGVNDQQKREITYDALPNDARQHINEEANPGRPVPYSDFKAYIEAVSQTARLEDNKDIIQISIVADGDPRGTLLHRRPHQANACMINLVINIMPLSTQMKTYASAFAPLRATTGAGRIPLNN